MRPARRPAPAACLGTLAALLLASAVAPPASAEGALALASPTTLPLNDVAFSRDGALALAAGGAPGQGVVLRIAGEQVSLARQDSHRYLAVAWSPASQVALLTGDGGLLRTTDGQQFAELALPPGLTGFNGRAIAWKPDGSQALVAGSALLRYWPGNASLELLRHSDDEAYGAVAWKPDGSAALLEQAKKLDGNWVTGRLLGYDGSQLTHVATYGQGNALVEGIAWAASGTWALVVGHDPAARNGPVVKWDGSALTQAFTKPADRFTALAWRPGGTKALLTGSTGERLVESDGSGYAVLLDQGADLLGVAWQPQGTHALLVGVGGLVLHWAPEGRPTARIVAPLSGQVVSGALEVLVRAEPRPGHTLQAVEARVGQGSWQALSPPAPGQPAWSLRLETGGLVDGEHMLEVRARDDGSTGEAARVMVRVLNNLPRAPRFLDAPSSDADGVVALRWSDSGADRYELQAARDAGFAQPVVVALTASTSAAALLDSVGTHYLRVRALVGQQASPWSEPIAIHVSLTEPATKPGDTSAPGAAERAPGGAAEEAPPGKRAPGPELALALSAALAAGLARRRR